MKKDKAHPLDIHIGQRLRLRRKLLGMSQSDLAKRVGVTFQQIQKYELGSNSVNARRLYEFSAILQISPLFFFDGYGQDTLQQRLGDYSTQAIHLVQDFTTIPSLKIRNSIAALVREVTKGGGDGA